MKHLVKGHGFVELPHAAALVAVKAQRRNAARRIRSAQSADHAIDEGGLPAGFAPPRWKNIIAVVDNDARSRRTQAQLNLALERGEVHMACWLRALRARHDGQENFSLPIFREN